MNAYEDNGEKSGILKERWRGHVCQNWSSHSLCFGWQMGPVVVPPEGWHGIPSPPVAADIHKMSPLVLFPYFFAKKAAAATD